MILERCIKRKAANWSNFDTTKGLYLRSLGPHFIHGAKRIEVYKEGFSLTMAVTSTFYSADFTIFRGFVSDDEDYQYHIEEWILRYEESS